MMNQRGIFKLMPVALIIIAFLASRVSAGAQADVPRLILSISVCQGDSTACEAWPGFRVAVGGVAEYVESDDGGVVTYSLEGLVPGSIQVRILPAEFDGTSGWTSDASCTSNGEALGSSFLDTGFAGDVFTFEATEATDVKCSYFFFPVSLSTGSEEGETQSVENELAGVTLPKTGTNPPLVDAGAHSTWFLALLAAGLLVVAAFSRRVSGGTRS